MMDDHRVELCRGATPVSVGYIGAIPTHETWWIERESNSIPYRPKMVRVVGNDPTTLRLRAESSAN